LGEFNYSPAAGTLLSAKLDQTLSFTFTLAAKANLTFPLCFLIMIHMHKFHKAAQRGKADMLNPGNIISVLSLPVECFSVLVF
jgi:hypothetical protein